MGKVCSGITFVSSHTFRHFEPLLSLIVRSYGSVVATHLLRSPETAQKIGPILFVDPVSFLLHHPDVAYNFVSLRQPPDNVFN